MQHDTPEDLDWLAFCYVADEMAPAEAVAFETRMADDQQAREAVARAVGLAFTLAAAGPDALAQPSPASRSASERRRGGMARLAAWATVAAAVGLAGVWANRSFQPPALPPGARLPSADDQVAAVPESPRQQLALLWSRTREELAVLAYDGATLDWVDSLEAVAWVSTEDPLELDLPTPDDLLAANDPPTWMLAAVEAGLGSAETENHGPSLLQEN